MLNPWTGGSRGIAQPDDHHITVAYKTEEQIGAGKYRSCHVYTYGEDNYVYNRKECYDEMWDDDNRGLPGRGKVLWPDVLDDGGVYELTRYLCLKHALGRHPWRPIEAGVALPTS